MTAWFRKNKSLLVFLICLGVFRTAVADWNPIPSGSMRPTLLEGDVVLVNRLAYDVKLPLTDISVLPLADPQRGDVVTFSSPRDGTRLIKRIVGVPGDVVEMRDDVLYVNGEAARYAGLSEGVEALGGGREASVVRATEHSAGRSRSVQFLPDVPARRDFGPVVVPAQSYFALGDNRDNSEDSRYIGVVARRLLIGRAHRIVVSADILADWRPRLDRIVRPIR